MTSGMAILLLGIVLFLGAHTFTTLRTARAGVIERLGEARYRGLYSLVAGLGFILIVWGFILYRRSGYIPVWDPPVWTKHIAILIMWFAFVMLAAMHGKGGRIKGWLRHPMLSAVKTWALAHLLANGDLGSIILFGSLLIWAGYDRFAVKWRGDLGAPRSDEFTRSDAIVLAAGTVAWVAMILLHPLLIGVSVFR
jgi:uncharacterized membrane protein